MSQMQVCSGGNYVCSESKEKFLFVVRFDWPWDGEIGEKGVSGIEVIGDKETDIVWDGNEDTGKDSRGGIEFKLFNTEFESEPLKVNKLGRNSDGSGSVFVEADLVDSEDPLKEDNILGRNKVSDNDEVAPTVWDKRNEEELALPTRDDKSARVHGQLMSVQFVELSEEGKGSAKLEFKLDKRGFKGGSKDIREFVPKKSSEFWRLPFEGEDNGGTGEEKEASNFELSISMEDFSVTGSVLIRKGRSDVGIGNDVVKEVALGIDPLSSSLSISLSSSSSGSLSLSDWDDVSLRGKSTKFPSVFSSVLLVELELVFFRWWNREGRKGRRWFGISSGSVWIPISFNIIWSSLIEKVSL